MATPAHTAVTAADANGAPIPHMLLAIAIADACFAAAWLLSVGPSLPPASAVLANSTADGTATVAVSACFVAGLGFSFGGVASCLWTAAFACYLHGALVEQKLDGWPTSSAVSAVMWGGPLLLVFLITPGAWLACRDAAGASEPFVAVTGYMFCAVALVVPSAAVLYSLVQLARVRLYVWRLERLALGWQQPLRTMEAAGEEEEQQPSFSARLSARLLSYLFAFVLCQGPGVAWQVLDRAGRTPPIPLTAAWLVSQPLQGTANMLVYAALASTSSGADGLTTSARRGRGLRAAVTASTNGAASVLTGSDEGTVLYS